MGFEQTVVGMFEDTIAMMIAKNFQIMTLKNNNKKQCFCCRPPALLIFLLSKSINDLGDWWSLLLETNHRNNLKELRVNNSYLFWRKFLVYCEEVNFLLWGDLGNAWSIQNIPSVFNSPTFFTTRWDYMDWGELL